MPTNIGDLTHNILILGISNSIDAIHHACDHVKPTRGYTIIKTNSCRGLRMRQPKRKPITLSGCVYTFRQLYTIATRAISRAAYNGKVHMGDFARAKTITSYQTKQLYSQLTIYGKKIGGREIMADDLQRLSRFVSVCYMNIFFGIHASSDATKIWCELILFRTHKNELRIILSEEMETDYLQTQYHVW